MAVTQISRIQHRRGLQQDLPQLASAEIGWSVDQRRLFIGNGTLEEGAPTVGVTEILTQYSDLSVLASVINSYTFGGNSAGYTAQTGASSLTPIVRSYTSKFDDFVNVRDFGALGDGTTDDTAAINRALQQIYKTGVVETQPLARRSIYFPGGTYLTSDTLQIPPFARLIGDGTSSAIIKINKANRSVANICDSKFQNDINIGSSSATKPQDVEIVGLQFFNSNTTHSVTRPIFQIDSATNVKILSSAFVANTAISYPNLVSVLTSVSAVDNVLFENCKFLNAGSGISIIGSDTRNLRLVGNYFENLANVALDLNNTQKSITFGNYFGNVGIVSYNSSANQFLSVGDNIYNTDSSLFLANLSLGHAKSLSLSSTQQVVLSIVGNTATEISYQITSSANVRYGVMNFVSNGSVTSFVDEYNQVGSFNPNVFANTDSLICSVQSDSALLKYSIKNFI